MRICFLKHLTKDLSCMKWLVLIYKEPKEVFCIPEDYEAGVMIAIGYQDTYHMLPPD